VKINCEREKEGLSLYRGEHAHMDDILTDDSSHLLGSSFYVIQGTLDREPESPSAWMYANVKSMSMICRTISSTTLFLHPCGFVILSSTWMHTNATPCRWFVELFRPQCCFFIHMDSWFSHPHGCIQMDNSSFFHPARYFFIHVRLWFSRAHGCIKCNSMWMIRRTISSATQFLHP
jgi:hypothetical protein